MRHFNPHESLPSDDSSDTPLVSSPATNLETVLHHLAEIKRRGLPYETAAVRIELLQNVLAQMHTDQESSQEVRARLQHELALASLEHLNTERNKQVDIALVACKEALQVYTLVQHPSQYAGVQVTLGNVYRERAVGAHLGDLERAIACYYEALHTYTLADAPYGYAQAHHGLGQTYQLRSEGARLDNLEQAIANCSQALEVYTRETFPFEHASTLHTFGSAYVRRVAGERRANLEQAITCFRQAEPIFTQEAFPREYAQGQHFLATAYSQRISGEQRTNLEQAITYYQQALHVYTRDTLPFEYAAIQNNLCIAYWQRIAGERIDNLEQAIACGHEGLRVSTLEAFPFRYAMLQNNLGAVYVIRVAGERRDNLEQAILCYREAMRVWTLQAFPYQYAKAQNNLGEAYQHRLAGERRDNLEQAILCYREAMRVWTREALPQDYAMVQRNLGATYQIRLDGEHQENLNLAVAAHREALRIYTIDAFPIEHRQVQLDCAETQALREDWEAAHNAYVAARSAEDLLVALGAGAVGRDAVLKEGRDAAIRDGFALIRLGRVEEAAVTIERGRASGLAEAMQFNAADPDRIRNARLRECYVAAHRAFIAAQTTLQSSLPRDKDEDNQRQTMLANTASYQEARASFYRVIEEIHTAKDPADFLQDTFDATMILKAVQCCGDGHALVYLAATPEGGLAIAVFAPRFPSYPILPGTPIASHFATLALPNLTEAFVSALIETHLDEAEYITGGFDCAQRGSCYPLLQNWPGATFREQAEALHGACITKGHISTLDEAAQFILSVPELAPLVDHALTTLSERNSSLLASTLNHMVLQRELQHCQLALREAVIAPLVAWLNAAGTCSLTLVPCGSLAAFPLEGILLSDGRTLGETLPTSIAPGARALLHEEWAISPRTGIYALGNPYPTQQNLRWGEAEAFALAELGNTLHQSARVKVQWQATREWLVEALQTGLVVNASCHGIFDSHDFMRSRLILAQEEELTLGDMLSYQADLRGLRLLILSACQTAMLDLQGARDEVRSLAAGMLQAGAAAILASLWAVDDRATYLLIVRFALEWFPHMSDEPPARALAHAQHWLRTVTNHELQTWQSLLSPVPTGVHMPETSEEGHTLVNSARLLAVRGRANRFDAAQAQDIIQADSVGLAPDTCPYADPYYWAGFQITGW